MEKIFYSLSFSFLHLQSHAQLYSIHNSHVDEFSFETQFSVNSWNPFFLILLHLIPVQINSLILCHLPVILSSLTFSVNWIPLKLIETWENKKAQQQLFLDNFLTPLFHHLFPLNLKWTDFKLFFLTKNSSLELNCWMFLLLKLFFNEVTIFFDLKLPIEINHKIHQKIHHFL